MKRKPVLEGYYNRNGYYVIEATTGNEVYVAGNHALESTTRVDPGSPPALSLKVLRKFCAQTTRDLAREHRAAYGGIARVEDEEKKDLT